MICTNTAITVAIPENEARELVGEIQQIIVRAARSEGCSEVEAIKRLMDLQMELRDGLRSLEGEDQ